MKRFNFFLLLFCWLTQLPAQTPLLNEAKYASYKVRLHNEFMIGTGATAGFSLPASIRDTVAQKIMWGDGTIDLAMYIGVLATEFMVNDLKGTSQGAITAELYYALEAFNRLDYNAEKYFGGTPSLNGFFVRDDVTTDSLNVSSVLLHLNQQGASGQITTLQSDLMASDPTLKEASLDQVIHLLAGLSLVHRYIPDSLTYKVNNVSLPFMDFETSIRQEAKHIATRLVNYMKEGNPVTVNLNVNDQNLYGINGSAWDFIIKNPVTGLAVARGANATALAAGFAAAKYWITGMLSLTTDTLLSAQALSTFLFYDNVILANDQDFKVMMLNAVGNVWPAGIKPDSSNFAYNALRLGPRAQFQSYEYIPLWHQSLYSSTNKLMSAVPSTHPFHNNPKGFYNFLLNDAPVGGPYNYNNNFFSSFEWSSTSRHVHPLRRGLANTPFPGHYNGLDYMLLYNLHYINTTLSTAVIYPETTSKTIMFYPNPARQQVSVSSLPPECNHTVTLINMQGTQQKMIMLLAKEQTLNISGLPAGIYFAHINGCNKVVFAKLVIY